MYPMQQYSQPSYGYGGGQYYNYSPVINKPPQFNYDPSYYRIAPTYVQDIYDYKPKYVNYDPTFVKNVRTIDPTYYSYTPKYVTNYYNYSGSSYTAAPPKYDTNYYNVPYQPQPWYPQQQGYSMPFAKSYAGPGGAFAYAG